MVFLIKKFRVGAQNVADQFAGLLVIRSIDTRQANQRRHFLRHASTVLVLLAIWLCTPFLASQKIVSADDDTVDKLERQRREQAAKELERNRERQKQLREQIERTKQWARYVLNVDRRSLIPQPERVSRLMQRWEKQRQLMMNRLLRLRHESRASISKGIAHNYLLEAVGEVAQDHVLYRRLKEGDGEKPPRSQNALEQKVLNGIGPEVQIEKDLTRHIRYSRGLIGRKLTGRLGEGPLDLHWPSVLRGDDFEYDRERVTKARNQAMRELGGGLPVSAETAEELRDAVLDLRGRIGRKKAWELQRIRKRGKRDLGDIFRYYDAERFVKHLVWGVSRLIEARSLGDLEMEQYKGGTIEELIAFMYRNNLRFAEADANGEAAYRRLFDYMAEYYVDVNALRLAISTADMELKDLEQQEQNLSDIKLGVAMDNRQKFALIMEAIQAFSDE